QPGVCVDGHPDERDVSEGADPTEACGPEGCETAHPRGLLRVIQGRADPLIARLSASRRHPTSFASLHRSSRCSTMSVSRSLREAPLYCHAMASKYDRF